MSDSGTGVTDSCELPCKRWELNPGPLEQSVLLSTEPSLQPLTSLLKAMAYLVKSRQLAQSIHCPDGAHQCYYNSDFSLPSSLDKQS